MNSESCKEIAELLVPYSDGELSGDDCRRVEAHLAACPECRSEIGVLGRSLELARAIWQESAAAVPPLHRVTPSPPHPVARSPRRWALRAASAAAVVLIAASWLFWPSSRGRESASNDRQEPPAAVQQPKPDSAQPQPELSDADIEEIIAREGRKARLLASIAILATEPSLKEYKERAERYLAEAYPDAPPGRQMPASPLQVPRKESKS